MQNNINITMYPCSDAGLFRNFVGAIRADGGGDSPEDIMGGLKVAFYNLSWRSEACKVWLLGIIFGTLAP